MDKNENDVDKINKRCYYILCYGSVAQLDRASITEKSNIQQMDLILCMTISHKRNLIHRYPNLEHKIHTLKEYVGITENGVEIKDPWGYDIVMYRYCASEIDEALEKLVEKIK